MLLNIRGAKFDNLDERKNFVKFLAATVEGRLGCQFEPYCPNQTDDSYWVFDSANNWRATFPEGDATAIDIRYRYQCDTVQAEEALATWLKFRAGATVRPNASFSREPKRSFGESAGSDS